MQNYCKIYRNPTKYQTNTEWPVSVHQPSTSFVQHLCSGTFQKSFGFFFILGLLSICVSYICIIQSLTLSTLFPFCFFQIDFFVAKVTKHEFSYHGGNLLFNWIFRLVIQFSPSSGNNRFPFCSFHRLKALIFHENFPSSPLPLIFSDFTSKLHKLLLDGDCSCAHNSCIQLLSLNGSLPVHGGSTVGTSVVAVCHVFPDLWNTDVRHRAIEFLVLSPNFLQSCPNQNKG